MSDQTLTIGRYHIRHELGRGMMGVVYLAHDPDLGRDIALKLIQLPLGATDTDRAGYEQRFFAEARSAARLSHPGIVVVHDVGRDSVTGAPFMALQLVPGQTLDRLLKEKKRLEVPEALRIALAVAEALQHAHAQGVIHRDIKPANIMILPGGEARIMDFGIAKLESLQLTATGQFVGTPLYMSPEQAMVQPVDGRSDVFSLGSVLYEMLTGVPAFFGESITKILIQLMQQEPLAPSALVETLPPSIDHIIRRCLAKELDRRYQTAQQLADDLRDVLEGKEPRSLLEGVVIPASLVATAPGVPQGPWVAATFPGTRPAAPGEGDSLSSTASATVVGPPPKGAPLAAGALALLAVLAILVSLSIPTTPAPPKPAVAASPTESTTEAPSPEPSPEPSPTPAEPARLVVDFEHSLKSGILRIFIDDEAVTRQTIGAKVTRRIIGIPFRKGRVNETIDVTPGRHKVRIQVTWDDSEKIEEAEATFRPGARLLLKAKLGSIAGLRKNLSLEWN